MPRSRDILQRFRPAGIPGAASSSGVPADRVAEASAELQPVLTLLAETQEEASRVRTDAEREAEQRRRQAMARASALVASAHREAAAERADAALGVGRRVEEENAAALAEAERDAAAVRRLAAERMSAFLDRVVAATRVAMRAGGAGL